MPIQEADLSKKKCKACEGGTPPLNESQVQQYLKILSGWSIEKGELVKVFSFKNYYETVSFVNAAAWIAHREDHHPEMEFGYKKCKVRYFTHSIQGLSENDFICAAKIDRLLA